jgi:hypothetical protein
MHLTSNGSDQCNDVNEITVLMRFDRKNVKKEKL